MEETCCSLVKPPSEFHAALPAVDERCLDSTGRLGILTGFSRLAGVVRPVAAPSRVFASEENLAVGHRDNQAFVPWQGVCVCLMKCRTSYRAAAKRETLSPAPPLLSTSLFFPLSLSPSVLPNPVVLAAALTADTETATRDQRRTKHDTAIVVLPGPRGEGEEEGGGGSISQARTAGIPIGFGLLGKKPPKKRICIRSIPIWIRTAQYGT